MVCTAALTDAIEAIEHEMGKLFVFRLFFINEIESGSIQPEHFTKVIEDTDVLLFDIRGNCKASELIISVLNGLRKMHPGQFKQKTIVSLVGGNEEMRRLTKLGAFEANRIPSGKRKEMGFDHVQDITDVVKKGIRIGESMKTLGKYLPFGMMKHARNWALLMDYWTYGHSGIPDNLKQMFLFILNEYLGHDEIKAAPPLKIPPFGIYDPVINQYFTSLDKYKERKGFDSSKQTVGLFYYGGIYFEQTLPVIVEFMERLKGYNIIPLYSEVLHNLESIQKFFFENGNNIVSIVINLQYFQINGGPFGGNNAETLALYKKMGVPQLNPIIVYDMMASAYHESPHGIIPINQVISVVMPELDGRIEMMAAGFMNSLGYSDVMNSTVLEIAPETETVSLICARVKKWLDLRVKRNQEKKIAIIIYDYPPGESRIGNAAYLDVSASITSLLGLLAREGYAVGQLPPEKPMHDLLLEAGAINNPEHVGKNTYGGIAITRPEYATLFNTLPSPVRDQVIGAWGNPPGKVMVHNGALRLPVLEFGNILVGLQPARSMVKGDADSYHDKDRPPHHQYIAFYKYLEQVARIDAIIHLGTHGTLEFLPGKECVGNALDFNINLLGSIPNIYVYHISNTSESAIAKRRSNAVIINHAGPPLRTAGSYQDISRLEALLQEYIKIDQQGTASTESIDINEEIQQVAAQIGLEYTSTSELEALIERYKAATITTGLHVLGKSYDIDEAATTIAEIAKNSLDVDPVVSSVATRFETPRDQSIDPLVAYCRSILEGRANGKDDIPPWLDRADQETFSSWVSGIYERMEMGSELANVVHALEGKFIEPGFGGDPVRTPSIFPTGRNSFGFDPRLIPSTVATRRGGEIAREMLARYNREHGTWPETMSVVLWAFETMKTGGETVGQVFEYLGVRAVKNKSVWTTELELVPLQELGHPRINVLVTICGIFRDTFPYIVDLINKAVNLVIDAGESLDENFVRKSVLQMESNHATHARARVFGPAPGRYNTNLTEMVAAGKWTNEDELAEDYISTMGHVYIENQQIIEDKNAFSDLIAMTEVMSQVRDSTEYHVSDLDHYYEFTGGLAKAREFLTGNRVPVLIADTTRRTITIDTLSNSVKEGTVTRTLNPAWIQAMLKHKHHGGQKVAERVENILGMAATAHAVDNQTWDQVHAQYIQNEDIKNQLIDNNRFAMMEVVKTLLQAERRGYWQASDEAIEQLKKLYLELENWVELNYQ